MNINKIWLLIFFILLANLYLFSQEVDYPDVLVHFNDASKQPVKGKLLMLDGGIYYIQTTEGRLKLKKEEIKKIDFIERTKEEILKTTPKKQKSLETPSEESVPEGDIIKFAISKGVSEEDANNLSKEIGLLGFTGKDKDKLFFLIIKAYQDNVPLDQSLKALKDLKDLNLEIDLEDIYIYTLQAVRDGISVDDCLKIIGDLNRENISGNVLNKLYNSIITLAQEGVPPDRSIDVIVALKRLKFESSETPAYLNLLFSQLRDGLSLDDGLNELQFLKTQELSSQELEDSFMLMSRIRREGAPLIDIETAFGELIKRKYENQYREKLLELIIEAKKNGVPLNTSFQTLSEVEDQKLSTSELIRLFEEKLKTEVDKVEKLKKDREDYLQ